MLQASLRAVALCSPLACAFALAHAQEGPPKSPKLPNIVLLYADDLGYGDLGCYNPLSNIATPHLDRLAAEGLRFLDAHSSSGICTPSRYALLTGRHHWRQFHDIVDSFGPSVLPRERVLLPEMLAAQGYVTACIGKWHLGWDWNTLRKPDAKLEVVDGKPRGYGPDAFDWSLAIPGGPLDHGFAHYFGDDVPNFPPYAWIRDDRIEVAPSVPFSADPEPVEGRAECRFGPMVAGWKLDAVMPTLTEHAVEWLEERIREQSKAREAGLEQPFFLYFPFTSPHAPIVPAAEFVGTSRAGPYGDYVQQSDATVGRILDVLERHGIAGETIVIFSADNGPEAYAYERVRVFEHRSAGVLRGLKRDVWEGGHRVPLIVRWPGVIGPNRTSDALFAQMDLMATLASVVGAALPDDAAEDSFDQLPVWRGESESVRDVMVHNTYAKKWAIRSQSWVLLEPADGTHNAIPAWFLEAEGFSASEEPVALFDIRSDLSQRANVAREYPERVAELRAMLAAVRAAKHTAPRLRSR